jgi:hypothetical protein
MIFRPAFLDPLGISLVLTGCLFTLVPTFPFHLRLVIALNAISMPMTLAE